MFKRGKTTVLKCLTACLAVLFASYAAAAQDTTKPAEHIIGTVTAVDSASHAVTVKEDKTGTEQKVLVGNTRTLIKVAPGAKDLKNAQRITADDLHVGDRVDVRGSKQPDDPNAITARSVVLMSERDLAQAHRAEAEAWQHSTNGVVTSVDPTAGKLTISERTSSGVTPVAVSTSAATAFTRYSPENPNTPAKSELSQIHPGDRVRILGTKNDDGSAITADKIYSGAFRTINGTITSVSLDGKTIDVKDLATKKPVEVSVNDQSEIRKLPPMMAMMLARRFNPNFRPAQAAGGQGQRAPQGEQQPHGNWQGGRPSGAASGQPGEAGEHAGMGGGFGGNISQMIERLPPINISDLKPGDAVVISGVALGEDGLRLLGTTVIAGVEPILQSAPSRSGGQAMGGDWGLGEMSVPQ